MSAVDAGNEISDVQMEWIERVSDLSRWAIERLANRTDAWGQYYEKQESFDIHQRTEKGELKSDTLNKHFAGIGRDRCGLHAIDPAGNTCKWVAIDVDAHSDADDFDINFNAACHWWKRLSDFGFNPILEDSNGAGGFHIWVLLADPVCSPVAFSFIQWIVRDFDELGFAKPPETFPKQHGLDERRRYGSWLRLPGKHHTREHWSRIWTGSGWSSGRGAVSELLKAVPSSSSLIPEEAVEFSPPKTIERRDLIVHDAGFRPKETEQERFELAAGWIASEAGAVSGQGGHGKTFAIVCTLIHGFLLPEARVRLLLDQWNKSCQPPWSESELDHKIDDALVAEPLYPSGHMLWKPFTEVEGLPSDLVELNDYRRMMNERAKLDAVTRGTRTFSRAPTGSGKSEAGFAAISEVSAGVLVVTTHSNAAEAFSDGLEAGRKGSSLNRDSVWLNQAPRRRSKPSYETCLYCRGDGCLFCSKSGVMLHLANCVNPAADKAEARGVFVLHGVCRSCANRKPCLEQHGFLQECRDYNLMLQTDGHQKHRVITHSRLGFKGFLSEGLGAALVEIHEDSLECLRPSIVVTLSELHAMLRVIEAIADDPETLNWDNADDTEWFIDAVEGLEYVIEEMEAATSTTALAGLPRSRRPFSASKLVDDTLEALKLKCPAQTGILDWLSGRFDRSAIMVDVSKPANVPITEKVLYCVRANVLPGDVTIRIGDSTLDPTELRAVLGASCEDVTPPGTLAFQQNAVQWPRDISRRQGADATLSVIRTVLLKFPSKIRVGVILHSKVVSTDGDRVDLKGLEPELRERIQKVSYFGKGDDRASNSWHVECDLLVVVGTPRIPSSAIRQRIMQGSDWSDDSFCYDAEFQPYCWEALTVSGRSRPVWTKGYDNPRWQQAFINLTRANLVQAIGRARLVTKLAIPVVAVTAERTNLPVLDHDWTPMGPEKYAVYCAMPDDGAGVKSSTIASTLGLSRDTVKGHLNDLEASGFVERNSPTARIWRKAVIECWSERSIQRLPSPL